MRGKVIFMDLRTERDIFLHGICGKAFLSNRSNGLLLPPSPFLSLPCYFYRLELLGKAAPRGVLPHLTETAFQIGH